jgi:hypothetical protein
LRPFAFAAPSSFVFVASGAGCLAIRETILKVFRSLMQADPFDITFLEKFESSRAGGAEALEFVRLF